MKASELRIGNWVDGNASGEYFKITAKQILDFYDDPLDDYYQPVPLTEEWFVKFGAEFPDFFPNRISGYLFGFFIQYINGVWEIEIGKDADPDSNHWVKLPYVHTAQNLIFALTGEELTLKDND